MTIDAAKLHTQKSKLFYSPNSPYARKCRVVVAEKGLADAVQMVSLMPSDNPPELVASNPLGTVPALLLADGSALCGITTLCESPVICEYLDSLTPQNPLFPTSSKERFAALALAALADGIMDAAVAIVMEGRRPEEKRYDYIVQRKEKSILRTIGKISELDLAAYGWNIGTINTAIALEYVDFRLPQLKWQGEYPQLAAWLAVVSAKPAMVKTRPSI